VLSRHSEHIQGSGVCGIATLLGIQLFPNAAEKFGFMTHCREHATQEEEIPC
jgi:hypothetical protein